MLPQIELLQFFRAPSFFNCLGSFKTELQRIWMLEGVNTFSIMKPLTSKQLQRIEKKKKKMAAFLEIAKLNDKDREAKAEMHRSREQGQSSDSDNSTNQSLTHEGPSRKRHKKDNAPQDILTEIADKVPEIVIPNHTEERFVAVPIEQDNLIVQPHPEELSKTGKKKLSGEEFLQLKRDLRERKNRLKNQPRFRLKAVGESASLSEAEESRTPVFLSDVQHLLMFALLGHQSPYWPTRWCQLEKYNRLSHTVVLLVEGFSMYDFLSNESYFPAIRKRFENRVEVITPTAYNGSLVEELVSVPLTGTHKEKLIKEFGSLEAAVKNQDDLYKILRAIFPIVESPSGEATPHPSDSFPRTQLLLSPLQLLEENYPLPMKGELRHRYSNYVFTKDLYQEVTPLSPMFGLDCEMCQTTTGRLELTRVSLVDEQLKVVYENYVKPYNHITNYLTRYSGITKQVLADVKVRLEDVQQHLRSLLPSDAILVGQSLNFDLQSLKMMHPYVIDTSVVYNITGDRFRKTKLKTLTQKFLGEDIQDSKEGHCSVEDSSASLKLIQLKLANSIEFGDAILTGCRLAEENRERQRLIQSQPQAVTEAYASSLFSHVTRVEKTAAIVSCSDVMDKYSLYIKTTLANSDSNGDKSDNGRTLKCLVETSNNNVVTRTCEVAFEHAFTLAHIQFPMEGSMSKEDACVQLDDWCKTIFKHVAWNGMCIVLLGGSPGGANGACFITVKKPKMIASRL